MSASINSKSDGTRRSLNAEQRAKVDSLKASLSEVDSLVQRVQLRELLVDDSLNSARATVQTARKEVASATKALAVGGVMLAVGSAAACLSATQTRPVSGDMTRLSTQDAPPLAIAQEPVAAAGGAQASVSAKKIEPMNVDRPSAQPSFSSEKGMSASKIRKALGHSISGGDGRCAGEPEGRDRESLSGGTDRGSYKDGTPRTDWSQDPRWQTAEEMRRQADGHEKIARGYTDDSTEAFWSKKRFYESWDRSKDASEENGKARSLRAEANRLENEIHRDETRERSDHGDCNIV